MCFSPASLPLVLHDELHKLCGRRKNLRASVKEEEGRGVGGDRGAHLLVQLHVCIVPLSSLLSLCHMCA